MREKIDYLIKKYEIYISNLEWHISTNKPTESYLTICTQRISDFSEVIEDLEKLNKITS